MSPQWCRTCLMIMHLHDFLHKHRLGRNDQNDQLLPKNPIACAFLHWWVYFATQVPVAFCRGGGFRLPRLLLTSMWWSMLCRVKLVGKGASVLMGRVVVGGEGALVLTHVPLHVTSPVPLPCFRIDRDISCDVSSWTASLQGRRPFNLSHVPHVLHVPTDINHARSRMTNVCALVHLSLSQCSN
jgi:hypothetical protein